MESAFPPPNVPNIFRLRRMAEILLRVPVLWGYKKDMEFILLVGGHMEIDLDCGRMKKDWMKSVLVLGHIVIFQTVCFLPHC